MDLFGSQIQYCGARSMDLYGSGLKIFRHITLVADMK